MFRFITTYFLDTDVMLALVLLQGCLAAFFARELITWECPPESAAASKQRSEEQALASASLDGTPQPLKRRRWGTCSFPSFSGKSKTVMLLCMPCHRTINRTTGARFRSYTFLLCFWVASHFCLG